MRRRPLLAAFLAIAVALPIYAGLVALRVIEDRYLRLARPALTVIAPLVMGFFVARARREKARGARTHLEDAALSATALALCLVAVGVEIGRPLDRMTVIVVVDESRSIELVPGAADRISREISSAEKSMREHDRLAVVAFGASAATEQPPREKEEPAAPQRAVVLRDATDIEAAIRRALAEVPPDSAARIVLLSDGVATRGDALAGAHAALAAQIPVDAVVLEQEPGLDVRVASVRGPARGNAGETVELRVVTQSPREAEVEVRVLLDGKPIRAGKTTIAKGEDVMRLREKLPDAGLHRYDVQVTAADATIDQNVDDNAGSSFVRVRGSSSALVLEGDPGRAEFIKSVLEKAAFRVDVGGPATVPADLAGLVAYDVIVLSDVPASALAVSQVEALASYVRDMGGGLLLMGGDRGMGPGGYGKTPLEEVSPVSFDLKQDKRRASLAEVIGIDISGSMAANVAGRTKLDLANEAASRSARLLGPADRLGVEHVDTVVHWTIPLGAVDNPDAIEAAIRSMPVGGGGIVVPITLDEAYEKLRGETVNLKHVLLFADGDDAEQAEESQASVARAKADGITTSIIALGHGHDTATLEKLSTLGGGRFYLIEDAQRLPSVFAQETILASRSALVEDPFRVDPATPGDPTAGIDFGAAPDLLGYVVTIPKPRALVHLTGPEGDPILAAWSVGLGRAAAFTSDLKDRWGVDWTAWAGAARMLAQTARDIARRADDERVRLDANVAGGKLTVRATVVGDDGRSDSFRRLHARVMGPSGFSRDVVLEPSSTGTYGAELGLERPGTYVVLAKDDVSDEAVGTTGAVLSSGEELRPTGSDPGLLARVAELSGGKVRTTLDGVFADRTARRFAYEDLERALLWAAAALLVAMVAARKLGVPEPIADLYGRVRQRIADRESARARKAAVRADAEKATMQSLLSTKRKAAEAAPRPLPPLPPIGPTERARPAAHHQNKKEDDPPAPKPPTPPAAGAGGKPMTTAELLLARKKARK